MKSRKIHEDNIINTQKQVDDEYKKDDTGLTTIVLDNLQSLLLSIKE